MKVDIYSFYRHIAFSIQELFVIGLLPIIRLALFGILRLSLLPPYSPCLLYYVALFPRYYCEVVIQLRSKSGEQVACDSGAVGMFV